MKSIRNFLQKVRFFNLLREILLVFSPLFSEIFSSHPKVQINIPTLTINMLTAIYALDKCQHTSAVLQFANIYLFNRIREFTFVQCFLCAENIVIPLIL